MTAPLLVALSALVAVFLLTELARRLAWRYRIVDRPARHKPHARPTPLLGGGAMAVGVLLPVWLLLPGGQPLVVVILLASAAVALTGLADDIRPLPIAPRLLVEAAAAGAVVAAGDRFGLLRGWPDALVTAAWIVVVTNSFNLLDNADGAAAAVGAATAAVLATAALLGGRDGIGLLLVALCAGCLGFLAHNWPPARIFMGDAGSLLIGFVLTSSAVAVRVPAGQLASATWLLLITSVATVDTGLVVVARTRARRSWFAGGTDHTAHRLRRLGLDPAQVVLVLATVALGTGLLGLSVLHHLLPAPPVLVLATTVAVAAIGLFLKVPSSIRDSP